LDIKPLKAAELQPPLNVTFIRDEAGLEKLKDFFNRCGGILGWDIETDPKKDYYWRRIRTIQFGNQQEQYVIDLLPFFDNDPDKLFRLQGNYGLQLPESMRRLVTVLKDVLCSKDFLKIGVNLSFEYENFYWLLGLRAWNFFCCAMVERCIWAGAHSLKDYGFYSMEELMHRYFHVQIDKELQESFTLDAELTPDQIAYAALDTRFPIALRQVQLLILQGETYESLKRKGNPAAKFLKDIEAIVTGDNLMEVAQIENDAIGAFQDMHVHGERMDRERWLERVAKRRVELKQVIANELDPIFIPIVGRKSEVITDEEIATAEAKWKSYNIVSDQELSLKTAIRSAKKLAPDMVPALEEQRLALEKARKEEKEKYKALCSELSKKRTAIRNLAEKCEGEALINYSSGAQVLNIFHGMKGLKNLKDTEDENLEPYEHIPVVSGYRKYRTLAKEVKTYGEQWAMEWKTKPCKEEGWLHPGDGRLHCSFNQYDAETGRSSSEQPNAQNLPKDKEVRGCFISNPADESIRISVCCDAETVEKFNNGNGGFVCTKCRLLCETKAEEYVMVTADMSGAELRILADLASEPVWINAFNRGEDVHCVCVELMDEETWPILALPDCAYYQTSEDGTLRRKKCKCPEHNTLRDDMKPMNFGIPYGISDTALARQVKKALSIIQERMGKHKQKFPRLWTYLDNSALMAKIKKKSFDMFGRRRLFPEPTWERAKEKCKEDREEKLRLPKEEADRNKANFIALHGRKPTKDELWLLKHRLPTNKEIASTFKGMHGTIERQGKNHEIQGTNATIAKKAMGCGFCPAGKPYLWHTLPQYKAKLLKFVHDELVIQCPKRYGQTVAELIGDAFKRAAAEKMKRVVMEFEYNIATYWKK
jgi:DNA polymerase I-like protein with 3'-5' exonuclease and polymerase domains